MMSLSSAMPISVVLLLCMVSHAFAFGVAFYSKRQTSSCAVLRMSGFGVADTYSWTEEAFDLDVKVPVPPGTSARDLKFHATAQSVELLLTTPEGKTKKLLDGNRKLRGRICLDGTFWILEDSREQVTITLEKRLATPKHEFDVIDYEWKGVYKDEAEGEVSRRHYDPPETLDVREYAASLGVDIDNLNMSLVDKTMFTSGLNLTQSSLDQLTKAGYVEEVTQQKDGKQHISGEDGEAVPLVENGQINPNLPKTTKPNADRIPFLDTSSPWHETIPVERVKSNGEKGYVVEETKDVSGTSGQANEKKKKKKKKKKLSGGRPSFQDPLEDLTVERLKEILRSQGLKVSGNKKELQDRLRQQVNTILQGGGG